MSCDFGPIPLPTSHLQSYWEQRLSHNSTTNPSRSAPVVKPEQKDNIIPQLHQALEKLADEQQRKEGEGEQEEREQMPPLGVRRDRANHRREQSFGQRLLSGGMEWWNNLGAEQQQSVQKASLPFSRDEWCGVARKQERKLTTPPDEAVMSARSLEQPACKEDKRRSDYSAGRTAKSQRHLSPLPALHNTPRRGSWRNTASRDFR